MCIGYSYGQTFVCVLNIALVKRLHVYWIKLWSNVCMCIGYSFGQTFVCVLDIAMVKRVYVY